MVKFVKTISPTLYVHSLLGATKHSGKIKLQVVFSPKIFLNKPKFNRFKKCAVFFILTSSTNIETHKAKFEARCS